MNDSDPNKTVAAAHERWFAEEVSPHEPALRSYLRSHFPSVVDVDDLVQESYIRLWRARALGPINSARAFLFTAVRRLALDLLRHNRVVSFDSIEETTALRVVEGGERVPDTVCRDEEKKILADAIGALPTRCRQVFTLRKLYNLSQKDIAVRLGISESTVEAQIDKGMKRCAAYLRQRTLL